MNTVTVRMGVGGNQTPVFTIAGHSAEFTRPFGATRNQETGLWMYPAYFPVATRVLEDLKALPFKLEFTPSVDKHIAQLQDVEQLYRDVKLPDGFSFVTTPFEHQVLGLAHAYYMLRSALFYAAGLGKSKIAVDLVRLLHFTGKPVRAIFMGPVVSVRNWGKEIDVHSGKTLRHIAVLGEREEKEAAIRRAGEGECDILLVSYETATRLTDLILESYDYDLIVADESHRIKNWSANRTKAAFELGQKAVRKVIMTGTPTLGSPDDVYGQFRFLAPYFMPENPRQFQSRFFQYSPGNRYKVVGYRNLDILNARTVFLAIRRTKEECLDLPLRPPPVDVVFDLTRAQKVAYNKLLAEMSIDVDALAAWINQVRSGDLEPLRSGDGRTYHVPQIAVLLNKLAQIRSGFLLTKHLNAGVCDGCEHLSRCVTRRIEPYTKQCVVHPSEPEPTLTLLEGENAALDALDQKLDEVLGDPSNKVIVWCKYSFPGTELDMVEDLLKRRGYGYVRIHNSNEAFDKAERFNADPALRVYVAQVATGISLTLNSANHMIYYSLDTALDPYLQSMDRNYRIGQTRNVTVWRLMGANTLDSTIARLLDDKIELDRYLTVPDVAIPVYVARRGLSARIIEE